MFHKKPMVCLFDCEDAIVGKLKELKIGGYNGSMGSSVRVNNKSNEEKFVRLNHNFPNNLHEFDVVVLDLTTNKTENYDPQRHQLRGNSGDTAHILLSEYPEQIFDPVPLSIYLAEKDLTELSEKKSIIIAFCGSEKKIVYKFLKISGDQANIVERREFSNFAFYRGFPEKRSRHGVKVKIYNKDYKLSPLFIKYLDDITYETCFDHPMVWVDGRLQKSENFFPILVNERDEIVGYIHFVGKTFVLVLPNIKNKPDFISELFKNYLPEIIPDIFPFHGEFKWLENGDYPLPGERQLHLHREEIENRYKKDISENDGEFIRLKEKYRFLTDLISETGKSLVSAVEHYLKWLGFESVINLDDTDPDLLEEDIQVDCGNRFLVVEVKGIGGTSTDKDCAQISKIRYRRSEQRGKFDVFGLYIVNHQRYLPPKLRSNPPFTDEQINDAKLDKRGILSSYQLYNAYFHIEEGILTKAEVREALFKTGLISLEPEGLVKIGNVDEVLKDGYVIILNISGILLNVNDCLIIKRQGEIFKVTIESLQVNDRNVETCNEGEVGIKINKSIKKNSEVFLRRV